MNIPSQPGSWISALNKSAEPRIKQHSHIGYLKFVQMEANKLTSRECLNQCYPTGNITILLFLKRSSEEMQAKDVPYLSPKALIGRK